MTANRLLSCVLWLGVLAGCQTGPLGGTRWEVVEWIAADPPVYERAVLEFRDNGQLVTTITAPDQAVDVNSRQHYHVSGDVITLRGPERSERGMFRLDSGQLYLHTSRCILQLRPLPGDGS